MVTLQQMTTAFNEARTARDLRQQEIRRAADKLREEALRYQRLAARKMGESWKMLNKRFEGDSVNWINSLLRPLLVEIEERTGWEFANKDDLRTFGLRAECPVHIDGDDAEDGCGKEWLAYLMFTPGRNYDTDTFCLYVDTGRMKEPRSPKGSLAELNGFDKESVEVTSVEQVIDMLQVQMNKAA